MIGENACGVKCNFQISDITGTLTIIGHYKKAVQKTAIVYI